MGYRLRRGQQDFLDIVRTALNYLNIAFWIKIYKNDENLLDCCQNTQQLIC